jgi:hypothetical protein
MELRGIEKKELMTLKELSERFSFPLSTLRIYASQRRFPLLKVGRRIYVDPYEFKLWLNRFKVEPIR